MAGPPEGLASLLRARRGYLGTLGTDGDPHILPVCFTWAGDVIWTAIDGKPKARAEQQRVKDIQANPRISFTVDRWDEDWSRLAWLQARGNARILPKGAEASKAVDALISKYAQYLDTPISGPVIRLEVEKWVGWSGDNS